MTDKFKQKYLKKDPSDNSPFKYVNGAFVLTNPIQTADFVQGQSGFSLDPSGQVSKINAFGGNTVLYDAVVDASGKGQYVSIQDALADGKKRIFVRAGTYILNSNIVLSSNTIIVGEDKYGTIINCNGNYQILIQGDVPYFTGTISVTVSSAIVTGSGTNWLSSITAGDYIGFNSSIYKILSVDSDTQITLEETYRGNTESGIIYFAGTFKNNVSLQNFTIKNSKSDKQPINVQSLVSGFFSELIIKDNNYGGGQFRYVYNSYFNNLIIRNNSYSIVFRDCFSNTINNIIYTNNYGEFYLKDSNNNNISNINGSINFMPYGLSIIGIVGSDYNKFSNIDANNGDYGVVIYQSNHNKFSNINTNYNDNDGFSISDSNNNVITNLTSEENKDHGFYISNGHYNKITNSNIINNSQRTNNEYSEIFIADSSTYNKIIGNTIKSSLTNKAAYGIKENEEDGSDNYNIILGNSVEGAVTANILTQGANTIKANNIE